MQKINMNQYIIYLQAGRAAGFGCIPVRLARMVFVTGVHFSYFRTIVTRIDCINKNNE